MEWLPSHRFIEYHCAVIERLLNETGVFRSFFERFWTAGSLAHFLQQLFYCKDFCWKMTKKCLLKDEKTAPILRQKPAKNALFSSISRKKEGENQVAKCYQIYCLLSKVSFDWLLITDWWLLIIDYWLMIADYWLLMIDFRDSDLSPVLLDSIRNVQ